MKKKKKTVFPLPPSPFFRLKKLEKQIHSPGHASNNFFLSFSPSFLFFKAKRRWDFFFVLILIIVLYDYSLLLLSSHFVAIAVGVLSDTERVQGI